MSRVFLAKVGRVLRRKVGATLGRLYPLQKTLAVMAERPYELHFELTNLCNANCIFCPYQFQEREVETMSDEVFAARSFSRPRVDAMWPMAAISRLNCLLVRSGDRSVRVVPCGQEWKRRPCRGTSDRAIEGSDTRSPWP